MKKLLLFISLTALLAFSACKGGPTDADLAKAAQDKVKDVPGVTATAKDGVVTLTGEVADAAAKSKAEAAAKVEGAKSVDSKLTVKPTPAPAVPDPATKAAVEGALKKKGFNDVMVDATDKGVKLTGTVAKGKKQEAQMTATEAGKKPADASGLTEK